MRSPILLVALAILASATLPELAIGQIVLVEDFETPDTGNFQTYFAGDTLVTASNKWAVTVNSVDLYDALARAEAGAYDGTQAVDLTGSPDEGTMETVFATIPGGEYELTFHYARNNFLGADTGDAWVEVIGSSTVLRDTIQHDPASHAFDEYLLFQQTFTADATETTLRFIALDSGIAGITVDGIAVSTIDVTGIGNRGGRSGGDFIVRASPNPFTTTITVDYVTRKPGNVEVKIYDVLGRSIITLVQEYQAAGPHSVTWAANGHGSSITRAGVYLCVLFTPRGFSSHRILLLK